MPTSGRYTVYGVVPVEHEQGNADFNPDNQKVGGTVPIYHTDDKQEAMTLVREGGFTRNNQWLAAQWARDNESGGKFGNYPQEA